jgi:prepilin-type N-terminal cleavage/methylation domain-containing protein
MFSLRCRNAQGFTLVEVLTSMAILVCVAAGVAQLVAGALGAVRASWEQSSTAIMAAAKMEELRSLAWTYEPAEPGVAGVPRSDRTTDLSRPDRPARANAGLSLSPANALSVNSPPYVDYLDDCGRWVGNGNDPPEGAVFIRRWAIVPLADDQERTLALHVLVTTVRQEQGRVSSRRGRSGVETLLVSARTRLGQ